jgi:hypothetical protein
VEAVGVETVTVWRADRKLRWAAGAASVVLLLLSVRVLVAYGLIALLGVGLVLAAVFQTYWMLIRPRLTAGPDGVTVVAGRDVVRLPWAQIRRCEPGTDGLTIICADGRRVLSRFPQQRQAASDSPTEADLTAAYLAQRAAWERKPKGAAPRYEPPPPAPPRRR